MPRPRKTPPPMIERIDLPADMQSNMNDLARRRAWPLMLDAISGDRPLRKAARDIYLQGLADGYEVGQRTAKEAS